MSEEKYTPEQLEQMADQLLAGDNAPAGADKPASQDKAANKSVLDEKKLASLPAAALVASRYRKKLEAGRRDLVVAALMRRGFAYAVIKEAIKRIEEE